nr:MAG TPA: hypothetical protein [Caudoviricetes sp.]
MMETKSISTHPFAHILPHGAGRCKQLHAAGHGKEQQTMTKSWQGQNPHQLLSEFVYPMYFAGFRRL